MVQDKSLQSFARNMAEILPVVIGGFLRMQTNDLARGKISMPQFLVLDLIFRQGPLKMTRLAQDIGVSLPAMSGLVDRLFKMHLVERHFDNKDRRLIRITITAKAKNLIKDVNEQRRKGIVEIFGRLEEQERQDYLKILNKISNIVKQRRNRE